LYDYKIKEENKKLNDEGIVKYLNKIKESIKPKVGFFMVINIVYYILIIKEKRKMKGVIIL
jgi:hypothetical protein